MRKKYLVASWKANMPNLDAAGRFFQELKDMQLAISHEVVLCPSFVFIETAMKNLPTNIFLGAQDVSQYSNGPFTGEITASTLASFCVKYCIVGHMERRVFGDTDVITNKKIHRLLEQNITPIITVGDTLAEYKADKTRTVIERQIKEALAGIKDWQKLIFCYQPSWSIGTGHFTSVDQVNMIIEFIRKTISRITGVPMSGNLPVLYGGGVTLQNARDYLDSPEIDGIMTGLGVTNAKTFADFINMPFRKP